MVDNIKFNKIMPSLSPARKVTRTDPRGGNNPHTPFKESLERKQKKKKKENPTSVKGSASDIALSTIGRKHVADRKGADRRSPSSEPARSRLIDIRV